VACRLYTIFAHYLVNGTIFQERDVEHKMRVLIRSMLLSEIVLILRITERDMIKMCIDLHVKVPVILVIV
jgi:hypothetical protein